MLPCRAIAAPLVGGGGARTVIERVRRRSASPA
jgi:hypothetical protein